MAKPIANHDVPQPEPEAGHHRWSSHCRCFPHDDGYRLAARIYNQHRMGAKMDRVTASLQRSLRREDTAAFTREMNYPSRWDRYFQGSMSLADLYRYPGQHYDHHRKQLTVTGVREQ
ncbi:hypothetical protein [Nocardia sp. NPDC049707]|uniref:hypothetical protein n=1 Tax=Nocardia sp. NPDC049707 TaxID=3154735 RepID=UPI003437CC2C